MRKNKVAKNVKEFLLDLIFMTAGSVIYAVGLNGFTAPNNIAPGGVSGIAIVLNYLFGTPVGTVILLINVPIIIWAIIEIGYKLVTKTMLAVVLNAACIDIVALFMPVYHGDPLIITLIGGVCEGVGLSLVFMRGATTGGTDMISAYTATTRIEGFANSFGDSGSAATSVLVAQNRGAGKEERVKESFRSSLFLMLAMGLAVSLIMYVSASTSVGFMLGTRSGAAFENARDYLKLVALFYTLCFTGSTFAGYFNGIGKVSVPFLGATSHIALRVVLSWLLVGKMGLPAVALATGLGWVLVNALWTFVKWRMEKKQKAAERDIM